MTLREERRRERTAEKPRPSRNYDSHVCILSEAGDIEKVSWLDC